MKTICTTNTAWSGTRKMTAALVDNLGREAPGGRRTFPTPAAMAAADEQFYKDVIRAGYRGPYLKALATDVAEGTLDLEELNNRELADDEVRARRAPFHRRLVYDQAPAVALAATGTPPPTSSTPSTRC